MTKIKKDNYKLQCKYCSIIIDEDKHSACEHSNSKYKRVKIKQYGVKHEKYINN